MALNNDDILVRNGALFASERALAIFHVVISPCVEWNPLISRVVNVYNRNPHTDLHFDLLGNLAG
jgi:hypothetical protein